MSVSVAMTAPPKRLELMERTLFAMCRWFVFQQEEAEFVAVVDGNKERHDDFERLLKEYSWFFKRTVLIRMDKSLSIIPVVYNNPALGVNIALRATREEIVLKMDPETIPITNLIRAAQTVYRENNLIFCSVRLLTQAETDFFANVRAEHPWSIFENCLKDLPDLWHIDENHHLPYWFGAIFSRTRFMQIGGVDERFLSGFAGEDDDWAERMRRSGVNWRWDDRLRILHQFHGAENKAYHLSPIHQHNIDLLLQNRRRELIQANDNHAWGDSRAVVSVQEFLKGKEIKP